MKNKFYNFLLVLLLLIFLIIMYYSISINKLCNTQIIKPVLVLLLSITYLCLLYKLNKFIKSKQKNEGNLIAVFLSILGFIGLFIFSYNFCILANRDLNTIVVDAKSLIESNKVINYDYYSIYSNQVGLLITVKNIFKLADIFNIDRNIFACFVSALCISVSMFFSYLCIKKTASKSVALTFLVYLLFNPLFYLLVSFYYSDIYILPIMSIVSYILLIINDDKLSIKKVLLLILVGLLSYAGYKIRPIAFFVLIAYYVAMCLKGRIKELLKYTIFIIIGLLIGTGIFHILEKSNNIKYDKNLKYPVTHWVMMGLNTENNGRWCATDYVSTGSRDSYDKKIDYNKKEILHRIKRNGILGNIKLQMKKLKTNWSYGDGAYASYYYSVTKYTKGYEYINGHNKIYLSYFLQINRVVLYILICISLLFEILKKEKDYNIIIIFSFGVLLFYSFWEVFYRYSFCVIPMFTILAAINFDKLSDISIKNRKISILKKFISLIAIIVTIFMFKQSYNYYCVKKVNYRTTAANSLIDVQGKEFEKLRFNLNEHTEYKQTFKTNKSFDYFKISYYAEKNVEGKIYLKVYDDKGRLIKEFAKNFINQRNKNYLVYTLDKPINTHNKTYSFIISTDIKDSNIELIGLKSTHYDYFPMGELYLNNNKLNSDLKVNIGKQVSEPLLSKKLYIGCALFIVVLQIYTFGLFILKKQINK